MDLLARLMRVFKPCHHVFAYEKMIDEQSLRGGYKHQSEVWRCVYCKKPMTIEKTPE